MNFSLEGTVPKKYAAAIVLTQTAINMAIAYRTVNKMAKHANELIEDRDQQVVILKEALFFLFDNGNIDPVAMSELNKNLNFWRVIRGIEVPCDCAAHEYIGRECTCDCDHSKDEPA